MSATDELLYLETDASCANCGLRDNRTLTIHHLDQSKPRNEKYDNKILLCHNCHQCHHQGRGPTAKELRDIKRRLIVKILTRPGLNALKLAQRQGAVVAMPFLVNHLIELGYLKYKETMSSWSSEAGTEAYDIDAAYEISSDGRDLLKKWQL